MTTSTPAGSYGRASLSTAFLQAYVDAQVAGVLDTAPETLDTLNELAAAINDDPAFFSSMATANAALQTNIDTLTTNASDARTALQTLLQNAVDAVQADVDTNEADADTAIAAEATARGTALTNLQTTLTALIDAVQADVNQNETDSDAADTALSNRLDTLEADPTTATALAAVQSDVDQNEADSDAAETALSNRIAVLEADPTTATAVAAVQSDVDANETASDAAETALSNRLDVLEADPTTKTYVDTQVAGLVDSAPGVLNTLDELAAALGDDANFATTITNSIAAVQTDVDANEVTAAGLVTAQNTAMLSAVAAVQADVDQNESDADTAIATKFDKSGGVLTGSLVVAKSFPDLQLKANDEKRLLFSDAGGGSTAAIKHVSTSLDFYAGGIASGNKEFSVDPTGVTVAASVTLAGGLTDAANDSDAATAGVDVGQLYRNGSVVMIRVS